MAVDLRILTLSAGAIALSAVAVALVKRRRVTPDELERRRRAFVSAHRRTIEGLITDADADSIHYNYELRGIEYFTSQDVHALRGRLPSDPSRLIGPVSVRFEPANPANSIVLCEEWSGLPATPELPETRSNPAKEETECKSTSI
jgi:hypothetical protein